MENIYKRRAQIMTITEKAAARLTEVSEDAATRRRLERELIFEMDQRDRLNASRDEGRQEGIEEGILKGKEETARAMKKEGMDPETIARITGLTEAKIKRL
jgi:predicted transposase/invertase (TIGR01784 family)